jgi:hypothetical protein
MEEKRRVVEVREEEGREGRRKAWRVGRRRTRTRRGSRGRREEEAGRPRGCIVVLLLVLLLLLRPVWGLLSRERGIRTCSFCCLSLLACRRCQQTA